MNLSEYNALGKEERKKVSFGQLPTLIKLSLFVILGVIVLVTSFVLMPGGSESDSNYTPIVENSALDGSVKQVNDYLKANLNDWDSYEGVEWSPVTVMDSIPLTYGVRHKYRAKNGFGAMILQEQVFKMDSAGRVIEVLPY